MTIEGADDQAGLQRVGRIVAEARDAMLAAVAPGVSTGELDGIGRDVLRQHGARSAPRLAYKFPGVTCISVNDEAAHEHGDVIADGNTISGLRGEEHCRCQHESALIGPERLVVDVDPGDPYASGGRDR